MIRKYLTGKENPIIIEQELATINGMIVEKVWKCGCFYKGFNQKLCKNHKHLPQTNRLYTWGIGNDLLQVSIEWLKENTSLYFDATYGSIEKTLTQMGIIHDCFTNKKAVKKVKEEIEFSTIKKMEDNRLSLYGEVYPTIHDIPTKKRNDSAICGYYNKEDGSDCFGIGDRVEWSNCNLSLGCCVCNGKSNYQY